MSTLYAHNQQLIAEKKRTLMLLQKQNEERRLMLELIAQQERELAELDQLIADEQQISHELDTQLNPFPLKTGQEEDVNVVVVRKDHQEEEDIEDEEDAPKKTKKPAKIDEALDEATTHLEQLINQ